MVCVPSTAAKRAAPGAPGVAFGDGDAQFDGARFGARAAATSMLSQMVVMTIRAMDRAPAAAAIATPFSGMLGSVHAHTP